MVNEIEHEQSVVSSDSEISGLPVPTRGEIGWLLVGGGVVGAAINLLRGQRGLVDWIAPVGLIGIGSGILLNQRQTHMEAAEQKIQAELDALDPVARAQVLRAVAADQIGRLPGMGSAD